MRSEIHTLWKTSQTFRSDVQGYLSVVEKYVELKEGEEKILKAVQRPILLLDKNSSPDDLDGISPGLGNVGVYLQYSGFYYVLFH